MKKKFKIQKLKGENKYRVVSIAQSATDVQECNSDALTQPVYYWSYGDGNGNFNTEQALLDARGDFPTNLSNTYYKYKRSVDWATSAVRGEIVYTDTKVETKEIRPEWEIRYLTKYSVSPERLQEEERCPDGGKYAYRAAISKQQFNRYYSTPEHVVDLTHLNVGRPDYQRYPRADKRFSSLSKVTATEIDVTDWTYNELSLNQANVEIVESTLPEEYEATILIGKDGNAKLRISLKQQ